MPLFVRLFTYSGMEGTPVGNIGCGTRTSEYQNVSKAPSPGNKRSGSRRHNEVSAQSEEQFISNVLGLNATHMWRDKLYTHVSFDTAERRLLAALAAAGQGPESSARKLIVIDSMDRLVPVRDIRPGEQLSHNDRIRYDFSNVARRLLDDNDPSVAEQAQQYLDFQEKERLRKEQGECCSDRL